MQNPNVINTSPNTLSKLFTGYESSMFAPGADRWGDPVHLPGSKQASYDVSGPQDSAACLGLWYQLLMFARALPHHILCSQKVNNSYYSVDVGPAHVVMLR